MGPTNKSITVIGGVTFPQLIEDYYEQAKGLVDGGADILLVETCNDTRTVKAALLAIERLRAARSAAAIPRHGLRHHRDHGHHAGRPDRRRVLRLHRCTPTCFPSA